jgi:hypothetical protein
VVSLPVPRSPPPRSVCRTPVFFLTIIRPIRVVCVRHSASRLWIRRKHRDISDRYLRGAPEFYAGNAY